VTVTLQQPARRNANLFTLDGNLLNRAGPSMTTGAAALREKLDITRHHRKNPP